MDKKNYDVNYVKTKCKQYILLLNKVRDKDIIEYLDSLQNRNGTLKRLLRDQIKKEEG